jgi:hypothetical protein
VEPALLFSEKQRSSKYTQKSEIMKTPTIEKSVEFYLRNGRPENSILLFPFAEAVAKVTVSKECRGNLLHRLHSEGSHAVIHSLT